MSISPTQTHQQFLRFSLHPNLTMMVETDRVVELVSIPHDRVVPMPHLAPAVRGIYNWRGEILWVVDLAMLLGMAVAPRRYHSLQQLVIMRSTGNDAAEFKTKGDRQTQAKIGFMVDEIAEIEDYDIAQIRLLLPESFADRRVGRIDPELARWMRGWWESETEEIYLVLNSQALFDRDDIHAYL